MMKELAAFPRIELETGEIAYGGSQDWFSKKWQRQAGCASVSTANIAAWYGVGVVPDRSKSGVPVFKSSTYLKLMEEMFRYMKPGPVGFPYPVKYQSRFLQFCAWHGRQFTSSEIANWGNEKDAAAFISKALENEDPVAMLLLTHRAKELSENTWHWMTITGIDRRKKEVILSNYGKREVWNAATLLEIHPKNKVTLIAFHEIPAAAV
ncbi:MAG: hypothetical protein LKJ76_06620 [Lachnospiraceae bacterium]|jgi:hypothetical protein|nr:hypothetical protein [Lachnospiraceae bacterium]